MEGPAEPGPPEVVATEQAATVQEHKEVQEVRRKAAEEAVQVGVEAEETTAVSR
jgi:hypothetical protein